MLPPCPAAAVLMIWKMAARAHRPPRKPSSPCLPPLVSRPTRRVFRGCGLKGWRGEQSDVGRKGTHRSPPPRTGRSPASRAPRASSCLSAQPTRPPVVSAACHALAAHTGMRLRSPTHCVLPAGAPQPCNRFSRHPRGRDVFRGLCGARVHLTVHDLPALVDVAGELLALGVGEALGGRLRGRSSHRTNPLVSQIAGSRAGG
jgi:hypothetical protein